MKMNQNNDLFSLKGKVIIVTGGTGILGQAFIDGIVEAGGIPCILGRNKEIAEQRAAEFTKQGFQALSLVADVLNETDLLNARNKVLEKFGRIDGLVNGAGGNSPKAVLDNDADVFEMNIAEMKKVMDLNVWGTIIPTQIFGESMIAAGGGSIVNVSSMNSKKAVTKVLGYNMGKAAVDCYNQWFAVELANRYSDKIRMNAIAPGFFLTDQNRYLLTDQSGELTLRGQKIIQQTPFKRFGRAEELIGALVWLLSDASSFVTGSMIYIDGGFSAFSGV